MAASFCFLRLAPLPWLNLMGVDLVGLLVAQVALVALVVIICVEINVTSSLWGGGRGEREREFLVFL